MNAPALEAGRFAGHRMLLVAALLTACTVVGLAICVPGLQVYTLAVGPVLALLVLNRLSRSNLLVTFIWMTSLVHLLKKLIFILGPQSIIVYYSILAIPTIVLLPVLFMTLPSLSVQWKRNTGKLLLIFVAWSCVSTLMPMVAMPWSARLAAVHERILPMLAFFVGLTIPLASATSLRILRALVFSALVSVAYGVVVFVGGPTGIERAWAGATSLYSLQGRNTLAYLEGAVGVEAWRGFSYYADPLTWGLFLVAALTATLALRDLRQDARWIRHTPLMIATLCAGLIVCATRTPWIGVLGMLGTHWLLKWRWARRPFVLFGIVIAGFALVIVLGTFLYERVMVLVPWSAITSPLAVRYLTMGTLEARIGAWNSMKEAFSTNPVFGAGFAYNEYFSRPLTGTTVGDPGAHNFMVETAVCTGIPGLLLFLGFLLCLFDEGVVRLRTSSQARAPLWMIAFLVGDVMTGYLSGSNFMNVYFFLLAGMFLSTETPTLTAETPA